MRTFSKKGLMDVFDFMFTVFVLFFMMFFITGSLHFGANGAQAASVENSQSFSVKTSAIDTLRMQFEQGKKVDPKSIGSFVDNSRRFKNKIVSMCSDYLNEQDCIGNEAGIINLRCEWDDGVGACVEEVENG